MHGFYQEFQVFSLGKHKTVLYKIDVMNTVYLVCVAGRIGIVEVILFLSGA